MARRSLAICVILGCLVLIIGCAGTVPPNAPRPEIVAPPEPNAVATAEPVPAAEPNNVEPEPVPQDANDTPEPDRIQVAQETAVPIEPITEPNVAEAAEPNATQVHEVGVSETGPPQIPIEPNDAVTDEPNEPVAVEPEPQEQEVVVEGPKAALPSFLKRYTGILQEHIRQNGRVDYSTLRRRRLRLKQLLMQLDELDPNAYAAWPQEEKLAFWINAYNLKMLETITRNYPIESSWWLRLTWPPSDIRHIKGIWTDYKFIVMDEEFTLTAVERRFFRKMFDEPRAYLAVTYATRSSPRLRHGPYLGADLDEQLDEQVSEFLSDPSGFRIDRAKKTVHLSALFKPSWRGKEFVGRYGTDKKFKDRPPETRAVLNFITKYLTREDVYFLETENYALEYMNFDWRINDTSRGF